MFSSKSGHDSQAVFDFILFCPLPDKAVLAAEFYGLFGARSDAYLKPPSIDESRFKLKLNGVIRDGRFSTCF